MELGWLKYFYEVGKTESVTQASERLRVSQPAVSKMIKQLEGALGYPLFQKSGRKIRLTRDGQNLMNHCRPIFAQLGEIGKIKTGVDADSDEMIRFGASDNLCNYLIPGCLQKFKRKFKNVQWTLYSGTSSEIKSRVLSGEVDFGIFYTRLSLREKQILDEKELGRVRFRVVYPPSFCTAGKKLRNLAAFNRAQIPYVGARMADYQHTTSEQWIYNRLKLNVENRIQVNSKETQKKLVLQGLGFGIFPEFMVEKELKSGKLVEFLGADTTMELILVTRKQESLSLIAERFVSVLVDAANRSAAWDHQD